MVVGGGGRGGAFKWANQGFDESVGGSSFQRQHTVAPAAAAEVSTKTKAAHTGSSSNNYY